MSSKIKDVNIKNERYYFYDKIINVKIFDPININIIKRHLQHLICDNQRFKIHKN